MRIDFTALLTMIQCCNVIRLCRGDVYFHAASNFLILLPR
jgi:hypothetical protein